MPARLVAENRPGDRAARRDMLPLAKRGGEPAEGLENSRWFSEPGPMKAVRRPNETWA